MSGHEHQAKATLSGEHVCKKGFAFSLRYHIGLKRSDLKNTYKSCNAKEKMDFIKNFEVTGGPSGACWFGHALVRDIC